MGTRTISITDKAYELLKIRKEVNDSFSDVIVKKFGRPSLLTLAGTLTREEAAKLRAHIKKRRETMRKHMEETARMLK